MAKPRISIIGPGVVGRCIGRLLRERRYPIVAVAGRSPGGARAAIRFIGAGRAARSPAAAARAGDVVFLTVPDRMIRPVCDEIAAAKGFKRGAVVLHCAGAHDASLLASARERKAHIAALHPLQSFASPVAAVKSMKGTCFTFDGDEKAAPVAERIVDSLGGRMVRIPAESRALYHAASCVLSNYLVSVVDLGSAMLALSGLGRAGAAKAAGPLLRGTVENIGKLGTPAALTGPISRGDVETVSLHLAALARLPREVLRLYCALGLYTVRVAQRKGTLKPAEARSLIRRLTDPAVQ